jgi:O-antigen/teichoic acid export membrane protein
MPDSEKVASEPTRQPPAANGGDGARGPEHESGSRAPDDWRRREVGLALRNAVKLGLSLLVTWGIALVGRLFIPRFLGPEQFGVLNFSDAFTSVAFVLLGLGLDTYVRREISVRPEHASDFVGGVVALRLCMTLVVYAVMELILSATGRSGEVRQLVYIFGLAQFFMVGSATSAGLLHSVGKVNEMSVLSVVTKLIWGAGVAAAVMLGLDLWVFAASFAASEGVKSLCLLVLAKRHLDMKFRWAPRETWLVLVASAPFFVSSIATTIYNKVDVTLLAFLTNDREVGWYGSAVGLGSLTLLLTPLISWVLLPLFARAKAASEAELGMMLRRSLEFILSLAVPVSLALSLGSELWVTLVFGEEFRPAHAALSVLAPAYLLMYVSIVYSSALAMLHKTWQMSAIFVGGLLVNPLLNLLLIPVLMARSGDGGGGVAAATSALLTELFVVAMLFRLVGMRGVDARLVRMVVKTLGVAAVVVAADLLLLRGLGKAHLLPAGALYIVLIWASGAVDVRGMRAWLQEAARQRKVNP